MKKIYLLTLGAFLYTTAPVFSSENHITEIVEENPLSKLLTFKDTTFEILNNLQYEDVVSVSSTSKINSKVCDEFLIWNRIAKKHNLPHFETYNKISLKPYFCLFDNKDIYNVKIDWLLSFMHQTDLEEVDGIPTRISHITLGNNKFVISYNASESDSQNNRQSIDPELHMDKLLQLHPKAYVEFTKSSVMRVSVRSGDLYDGIFSIAQGSEQYESLNDTSNLQLCLLHSNDKYVNFNFNVRYLG